MHTIHTTQGFIIGSRPYGDAGKILSIFTRDFGLVYATAQGIRLERSKLRYYIQDLSFGVYSLVRGREYWKMTSAAHDSRFKIYDLRADGKELIARIALLLRRLLQGEDAHPELFDLIFECARFLSEGSVSPDGGASINEEDMQTLESLVVARMLYALGYIGYIAEVNDEIKSTEINIELLRSFNSERKLINQHINKALKESML